MMLAARKIEDATLFPLFHACIAKINAGEVPGAMSSMRANAGDVFTQLRLLGQVIMDEAERGEKGC